MCLMLLIGAISAVPVAMPAPYALALPVADGGYKHNPYKLGRVKMQIYRGPSKDLGHYKKFAPWGYYVTQPKDNKPHYGYH